MIHFSRAYPYFYPSTKCTMHVIHATSTGHVPASRHKFIKFRGCLEAASERITVSLSSARTWTPFHHPHRKIPYEINLSQQIK